VLLPWTRAGKYRSRTFSAAQSAKNQCWEIPYPHGLRETVLEMVSSRYLVVFAAAAAKFIIRINRSNFIVSVDVIVDFSIAVSFIIFVVFADIVEGFASLLVLLSLLSFLTSLLILVLLLGLLSLLPLSMPLSIFALLTVLFSLLFMSVPTLGLALSVYSPVDACIRTGGIFFTPALVSTSAFLSGNGLFGSLFTFYRHPFGCSHLELSLCP